MIGARVWVRVPSEKTSLGIGRRPCSNGSRRGRRRIGLGLEEAGGTAPAPVAGEDPGGSSVIIDFVEKRRMKEEVEISEREYGGGSGLVY